MNRREAVQHLSLLLGGTIVGSTFFLNGCKTNGDKNVSFTADDIAYLDDIADTILPSTKTPGAKAAKVGSFIPVMVNDCYTEDEQKIFHDGMKKINDLSKKNYDKPFTESTPREKHDLLVMLDKEQKQFMQNKKPSDPSHYFRMMKELTLLGYFTSEIGCTQARRYVEVPGRYDGCVPYKTGDKAWA